MLHNLMVFHWNMPVCPRKIKLHITTFFHPIRLLDLTIIWLERFTQFIKCSKFLSKYFSFQLLLSPFKSIALAPIHCFSKFTIRIFSSHVQFMAIAIFAFSIFAGYCFFHIVPNSC